MQVSSSRARVRTPHLPSITYKSEQKHCYLVAKAEPLSHKIDISFYIIVYYTSREEKSGLINFAWHDRDLQ